MTNAYSKNIRLSLALNPHYLKEASEDHNRIYRDRQLSDRTMPSICKAMDTGKKIHCTI